MGLISPILDPQEGELTVLCGFGRKTAGCWTTRSRTSGRGGTFLPRPVKWRFKNRWLSRVQGHHFVKNLPWRASCRKFVPFRERSRRQRSRPTGSWAPPGRAASSSPPIVGPKLPHYSRYTFLARGAGGGGRRVVRWILWPSSSTCL